LRLEITSNFFFLFFRNRLNNKVQELQVEDISYYCNDWSRSSKFALQRRSYVFCNKNCKVVSHRAMELFFEHEITTSESITRAQRH
jgi:hypothetical protein